jgi:hypothetical protein
MNPPFRGVIAAGPGISQKFVLAIAGRRAYLMSTFRPFFFGPAPPIRRTADQKSSKT